jgi:hypothetical protein
MELISISNLFILSLTIISIPTISSVSVQDILKSDVIIDLNKGFSLRRLGVYSPNVVEQIVHTFLPLHNFCVASPNADVCAYDSENKTANVLELGTMVESRNTINTLSYSKSDVSRLIGNDLNRILTQHQPDKTIDDSKSIIQFFNKKFFYTKSSKDILESEPQSNAIKSYSNIPRLRSTSAEQILQHISNNEISFEYLPYDDLSLLLNTIFSTMDNSYTINNIQESLNTFNQLIIGQSVFALRYCLLSNTQLVSSQPCIAISTLFLQNSIDDMSRFTVFRLIPVPFIFNHEIYVYSNLPKMIGMNLIDNTLVSWNDDMDINDCKFLTVVLCKNKPVSIMLSKLSCLSQLFNDQSVSTSMCPVIRSQDVEESVFAIANGIWYIYDVEDEIRCDILSSTNEVIETITIKEPAVMRLPCDKKTICTNFKLPTVSCESIQITILPTPPFNVHEISRFFLPISNYGQTIKSSFRIQSEKLTHDLLSIHTSQQPTMKQIMRDIATATCSILILLMVIALLYVFKFIKYKLQKKINDLQSVIYDIALI